MAGKTALITGISGQDGSYLAELLLQKGYRVIGATRDPRLAPGPNLVHLSRQVEFRQTSYELESLTGLLRQIRPDEIYNFAGQTYVSKSWDIPRDTIDASAIIPCNLLQAILRSEIDAKFFQPSSCEIYTLNWEDVISEQSAVAPGNPYGCSKALAHHMVACYRQHYGLYAVSGILFHHESPRRNEAFASRKVVKGAIAIKLGRAQGLTLGNLDVSRDWGFAPDVMVAAAKMMQMSKPEDFVICTGETHSLRELVEAVFNLLGLDMDKYVRIDASLIRSAEPPIIRGSNENARRSLSWTPKTTFYDMLKKMVDYEMRLQSGAEQNFGNENPFV